ncbi:uncharacterized protein LOC115315573, partial [Ixodes scapularis]|uniref:uncharacterized protein LOC115315573 n=1 Tax=Ixodes scapularis TaxID=6945 RepID=UPI001A9DC085
NGHINWSDPETPIPSNLLDDVLLDILETTGPTQLCNSPSYTSRNGTTIFLDLALTNNPTLSHRCTVIPSLPGSDHQALLTNIHCTAPKQGHQARNFLQFAKTDFPHLNQLIHLAPWSIVFDHQLADDAYNLWLDMMSAIQRECAPVRVNRKRGNLPWMTKEIVTLVRCKNRLFNKARKNQNPTHLSQASQARKEVVVKYYRIAGVAICSTKN